MTNKDAIIWLRAVAIYFDRKASDSQEDREIMAMQQNSQNAIKIAELINNLK